MVVDFVLPGPGQGLLDAVEMWDNKSARADCDYSYHMAITWWGEQVFDEMAEVVKRGVNTFKHFMAYKGALMVNDDEMFASFRAARAGRLPLVHAENGDIVAELQRSCWSRATPAPRATPIRARPRSRARPPTAPS
jgi:dihydropyrimidinase